MSATNRYVVRWAEVEISPAAGAEEIVVGRYLLLDRVTGDYLPGWACVTREEAEGLLKVSGLEGV